MTTAMRTEEAAAGRLTATQRRSLLWWEVGAFAFINLVGALLHFVYELSGFHPAAALFGSVNESAWEHLKLYFYPGLLFALVEHAFVKDFAHNYWWGKAMALVTTPVVVLVAFYSYLGVVLPMWGEGALPLDIGTGVLGVIVGCVVSYRILTGPQRPPGRRTAGIALIVTMTAAFMAFTHVTPRLFVFEDFLGYEYQSEWGILDDYSRHRVFTDG